MYDDIKLSGWKVKMCYISCQASLGKLNNQEMSSLYWTVLKKEKKRENCNFPLLSCSISTKNMQEIHNSCV